ncbi:MAG: TIM barrel protein [Candidatus Diapherotrites archaeon]
MVYKKLIFGTAGIPLSTKDRNTTNGIERVKELGLGAMELEFVHSVNLNEEKAKEVNKAAEKNEIELTCHGQYYINLNSLEKTKVKASVQRILNAARIANTAGAKSMTFHAAFYMKMEKEKVYENVKRELKAIVKTLQSEGNKIWIRPEFTGKETQFGDLRELIRLSTDVEQVLPCIDFAHYHARYNGKMNSYEKFSELLEQIEKRLGKSALHNMHIHVSGINYSEKGEKSHAPLQESDLKYKELIKAWKDFGIKGIVISESPLIEEDALLMQKIYLK